MLDLCDDVLYEILNHCSERDTVSLCLVNKVSHLRLKNHTLLKNRRLLIEELQKAQPKYRPYYKSQIYNLQLGDRLTDNIYNYRVHQIDKKKGLLEVVDMYGEGFDIYVLATLNTPKTVKKSKGSYWAAHHYTDSFELIKKLKYGIIKHEYGPPITHADSFYLSCITKPKCCSDMCHFVGSPEVNMLVLVGHRYKLYEYIITHLCNTKLSLQLVNHIRSDEYIHKTLEAYKKSETWKIKNSKYKLLYFGAWRGRTN